MKGYQMALTAVLLLVMSAACAPRATTPAIPEAPVELPRDVEAAVKEALSARIDVEVEQIEVVSAQEEEWSDACLGLGRPEEGCAQVITPGWRVTLRAEGEEYVFRTDQDGSTVRMEEGDLLVE